MPRIARRAKTHPCPDPICSKSFGGAGDLNRHFKGVHLGQRPYECTYCPRIFAQKSALKTHTNTHTNNRPYKCEIAGCGMTFKDPSSASRHKREKHGSGRYISYQCSGFHPCQSTQRRRSSMKTHLKNRHGVYLTPSAMEDFLDTLQLVRSPESEPAGTPNCRSDSEDLLTPPSLPHHLSSSPAPSQGSPLTQYSEPLVDDTPFPAVQIHEPDMVYGTIYGQSTSLLLGPVYSTVPNSIHRSHGGYAPGLRGAFAHAHDIPYGDDAAYQDGYIYTQNGHLSVSPACSSAASPAVMSPSPEPHIYEPISFNPQNEYFDQMYWR